MSDQATVALFSAIYPPDPSKYGELIRKIDLELDWMMTDPIPGARAELPTVRPPCAVPPTGGWDTHCHVFGPYDQFPLAADRSYDPVEASSAAYLQLLATLGLSRAVLVQASAHGLDNRAMLAAIAAAPDRLRGVAVMDRGATLSDLQRLHGRGVRGLRFARLHGAGGEKLYKNVVDIDALPEMLPVIRRSGLHVQLWADLEHLADLAPIIRSANVPFVLDHMGRVDPMVGIDDPRFRLLCQLLEEGHVWVKLTPYRRSNQFPDYPDMRALHDELVNANPDRLVWGSDWPHINMPRHLPDAGHLLDLLVQWTPHPEILRKILVTNPMNLYEV